MILWSGRTIFFLQKHLDFCITWLRRHMMTHLPEPVSEQDIMEMFRFKEGFHIQRKLLQSQLFCNLYFSYADKNKDGQISYDEFLIMITPVKVNIL